MKKETPEKQPPETAVVRFTKNAEAVGVIEGMAEDAGGGFEGATADVFAVPRLQIIQATSKQLDPASGKYLNGAKAGDIFNSATGELYDGSVGIYVVPVAFRHEFIEWPPRTGAQEGAPVNVYAPSHPVVSTAHRNEERGLILENGNKLADTRTHFVLVLKGHPAGIERAIIGMASSQVKHSATWMTMMRNMQRRDAATGKIFTPATYALVYHLSVGPERNTKGRWLGWVVKYAGDVQDAALYRIAKTFKEEILGGKAAASYGDESAEEGTTETPF